VQVAAKYSKEILADVSATYLILEVAIDRTHTDPGYQAYFMHRSIETTLLGEQAQSEIENQKTRIWMRGENRVHETVE
jgi:hypothetical protein